MTLNIECDPKEIAALILAVQERRNVDAFTAEAKSATAAAVPSKNCEQISIEELYQDKTKLDGVLEKLTEIVEAYNQ